MHSRKVKAMYFCTSKKPSKEMEKCNEKDHYAERERGRENLMSES